MSGVAIFEGEMKCLHESLEQISDELSVKRSILFLLPPPPHHDDIELSGNPIPRLECGHDGSPFIHAAIKVG